MDKQKKIIMGVVLAIIILLIGYGFWPKPFSIESSTVTRGPMKVIVEEEGRTRVIDKYVITAPVSGLALRIDQNVGDSVHRNKTISFMEPMYSEVLDPRRTAEAEARIKATEAALQAAKETVHMAKTDADLADAELKRVQGLFDAGSATRQMIDHAKAEEMKAKAYLSSSNFAVEVATYEYEAAKTALKYAGTNHIKNTSQIAIKSPVNGCILKIQHKSEGIVPAGQPLLEVGNPQALEVEVDVLSSDAVKIIPGTKVQLERWGGDVPLDGLVRTVEPVGFTKYSALGVEEQRVLVIANITSPRKEWRRLGDGYRVVAQFIIWEKDNVLQAPTSALFRQDGQWSAFVVENGKARIRKVQVGHRSGLIAEILSGLKSGEIVITHPDDAIHDGSRVRVSD